MPRLLVVHHTPSPALQEMFEAAVSGARTDEIDDVEVVIRPALTAAALDVLANRLKPGDVVLVKASRAAHLEGVAAELLKEADR